MPSSTEVSREAVNLATGEVVMYGGEKPERAELDQVRTYEQIIADSGVREADLVFLGSVWRVVDKAELVNRPHVIVNGRFRFGGDYGGPYIILYVVTRDTSEMLIYTDGSTGIYRQLDDMTADGAEWLCQPNRPIVVPNGLRASTYELGEDGHAAPKGDDGKVVGGTGRYGTTYYLA